MKKVVYLLTVLLALSSCKKNDLGVDNGCISAITRHYVNAADSAAAAKLLLQNKISVKNLVFTRVTLNDTITNGLGETHINQEIFALQYFNGLPVFSSDIAFFFEDGVFRNSSGTRFTTFNLNTSSSLTLPQLRKLFITAAANSNEVLYQQLPQLNLKDSCLVAKFGYYDLNTGAVVDNPVFVKAWSVTPKNLNYPMGIFRDDTGGTILYTQGVLEF
jgi:hypothetical protein